MLSYYLDIEVRHGKECISQGQRAYVEKLLDRGGSAECKPCVTPIEERLKLSRHNTAATVDTMRYQSIIGGLGYLTLTRPDITFAVGYASRFMEDLRVDHCAMSRGRLITRSSSPRTVARVGYASRSSVRHPQG